MESRVPFRNEVSSTNDGEIELVGHCSGVLPLYYSFEEGKFCFSSRLRDVTTEYAADPQGVLEWLIGPYTMNGRTLLKGVQRLLPGERIQYRPGKGLIQKDESPLWRGASAQQDSNEDRLQQALLLASADPSTLMLSGGWDSRLLASACAAQGSAVAAYCHGDQQSREIAIARQVAAKCSIEFIGREITPEMFQLDQLIELFHASECVLFPHWYAAGRALRERGLTSVSSGIFGEVVGGHYSSPLIETGLAKIAAFARIFTQGGSRIESVDRLTEKLAAPWRTCPWFVQEDFFRSVTIDDICQGIFRDLRRLVARGIERVDTLIEAFVTEHRAVQYIAAQALALAPSVNVQLPFADTEFLTCSSLVPIEQKLHNRLSQRLIRRLRPELLELPLSATFFTADMPILVQEFGRVLRRGTETGRRMIGMQSQVRHSWIYYRFLETGSLLESIAETLTQPFWNREAIQRRIAESKQRSHLQFAHSTLEVFLKMLTVDLMLRK